LQLCLVAADDCNELAVNLILQLGQKNWVIYFILPLHLSLLFLKKHLNIAHHFKQIYLFLSILGYYIYSVEKLLFLFAKFGYSLLNLQGFVLVFMKKRVNIKNVREVKTVVNLLGSQGSLVVDYSVDLEKQCFRRLDYPTVLLNTYNFAFLVAIVVNVGYSKLFASLIQFSIFDINKKQTEKLLLTLFNLNLKIYTPSFLFMKVFSILPMNCSPTIDL